MPNPQKIPKLYSGGRELDTDPSRLGLLKSSAGQLGELDVLRNRMEEDGYLYLPGLLNRDDVLAARRSVLESIQKAGMLHPDFPLIDGVAKPGLRANFDPAHAKNSRPVHRMAYEGPMMDFFETFLGGPVRHFDYTWLRTKAPGKEHATPPHCDIVYMGRGTKKLFTAWTPLGDVPLEMGGLMLMERSKHRADILGEYWKLDVDHYCTNSEEAREIESGRKSWADDKQGGSFNPDAAALREHFEGRWLTSGFSVGDVLVFSMFTLHASGDNQTDRIRISTDTRYQLASEPADERWIGENPIAHGVDAKVGMIC
jgi:hypothetical protein